MSTADFVPSSDLTIGTLRCPCGRYNQIGESGPNDGVTGPCHCGTALAAPGDHQINPVMTIVEAGSHWQSRRAVPPSGSGQKQYGAIRIDPIVGVRESTIIVWVAEGHYIRVTFPHLRGYEALIRYLLRHWWVWLLEGASQHYCEWESWNLAADWYASQDRDVWDHRRSFTRLTAEVTTGMVNMVLSDRSRSAAFQPSAAGVMRANPLSDVPATPDGYDPTTYRHGVIFNFRTSVLAFECTEDYMHARWTSSVMGRWWRPQMCQTHSWFWHAHVLGFEPSEQPTLWQGWVDMFREYRTWHPGRAPNPRRVTHAVRYRINNTLVRVCQPGRPVVSEQDPHNATLWNRLYTQRDESLPRILLRPQGRG